MGDWKGVKLAPNKPLELYDLSKDLGETKNVADEHPGVVKKIEGYLKKSRTDSSIFVLK